MKVVCANEKCASVDRPKPIFLEEGNLLKVYEHYKCPYCRGDLFRIIK